MCFLFKRNLQKSIISSKSSSGNDEKHLNHENDHQLKADILIEKPCFHGFSKNNLSLGGPMAAARQ